MYSFFLLHYLFTNMFFLFFNLACLHYYTHRLNILSLEMLYVVWKPNTKKSLRFFFIASFSLFVMSFIYYYYYQQQLYVEYQTLLQRAISLPLFISPLVSQVPCLHFLSTPYPLQSDPSFLPVPRQFLLMLLLTTSQPQNCPAGNTFKNWL